MDNEVIKVEQYSKMLQTVRRAIYGQCAECGWVGPREVCAFGHNDIYCPKCGKEAVGDLHHATKVEDLIDVTKLTCLACTRFGESCDGLNCDVLPSGIQFWKKLQTVAIKDGYVKAWWEA